MGRTVYLGLQNEREWARFCEVVLERPDMATDSRFSSNSQRVQHRDAMDAIITETFRPLTADAVVDRLERAQIANARMRTVPEFIAHPQLEARDRWREVASPVGPIRMLRPPFIFDDMEPVMGPIPAVGAHTDAILGELGVTPETIARWRERGVI